MTSTPPDGRRARGFHAAAVLVAPKLAAAARRHGFTEARLLTDWEAIVGPEIASAARPVKMTRSRHGGAPGGPGGGTLTVLAEGSRAPEVQMMLPTLKARINAALGWTAVSHVRVTQARRGFAEAAASFRPRRDPPAAAAHPDPARLDPVLDELSSIGDGGLRTALETLARNVLSRRATRTSPGSR